MDLGSSVFELSQQISLSILIQLINIFGYGERIKHGKTAIAVSAPSV